ncbi:MAG: hypothetical protein FWD65_07475 [Coriobacteriia bacterium]|nr:hypothetical protein [Coriobacteriia bacterium]
MAGTAIVNAKVDSYLKERVDAILRRESRSASEVIKATWEEIARTGDIPQGLREHTEAEKQKLREEKLRVLESAICHSGAHPEDANRDAREIMTDILLERYGYV